MKQVFLLIVVLALFVPLGFAQTSDTGSKPDPASVKGCLGGSDGNYTVVEDGTLQTIKITTSAVDLKPHLGHDVTLIGSKASGAANSTADRSFAVTELNMISEHCAAAAAAPAATVIPPSDTVIAPDPAATAPPATASVPAVDATVPVSPSAVTVTTAPVEAAATAAPPSPPAATVSSPAPEATHAPRPSAHARKVAAAQAAAATVPETTVSPSPEPAGPPAADVVAPATTASPAAEAVRAADAAAPAAPAPAPAVTHRASSLPLLVAFVVLVIVLGTTAPLIGRWRKRKMLERDGSPNLSFTNEEVIEPEVTTNAASSGHSKREPRKVA